MINNCTTYTSENVQPKSFYVEFNTFDGQEYPGVLECIEALELHQNISLSNVEFVEYEKIGNGRARAIFHQIIPT